MGEYLEASVMEEVLMMLDLPKSKTARRKRKIYIIKREREKKMMKKL